jgi:AcrR family transcriptional regulator
MARRSEHSKEEIKELAISSACKLVAEKGNDGFKARSIAKAMGYTVGTIYYLFGNMENLRFHVCGSILDEHLSFTEKQLSKKKNRLVYMLMAYIKLSQNHENFWKFLFSYNPSPKTKVPNWYLQKTQILFKQLYDSFLPYTKTKAATIRAVRVMWAGVHGISAFSLNGRLSHYGDNNPEALAKHLIKTYLAGLNK